VIVTYVYSHLPGDAFRVQLRCRNFAGAINRLGWHRAHLLDLDSFIQNTLEAHRACTASDLIVIHRYLYGPVLQAVAYWKARDKKVVVDLDQAINYLTPGIPGHSFWLEGEPLGSCTPGDPYSETKIDPLPLEQFKWGLGLIDAALVSSTLLAVDWSQYTEVYEIPDYINTDQYPASRQPHENEIWVGLANGTRTASIRDSGLLAALETLCRERPQVRLVVCDLEEPVGRVLDIDPSQIVTYPPDVFEQWAEMLLRLDLGLVPTHGDYDLRLGRASVLEFMISKIPWIASNQPAFRELSRYGRLVQNTSGAWELALQKSVDNIDALQKRAAGGPFVFALSQDINENLDKVLKLFTHVLNQAS
jgi:hypothetical protein